MASFVPVNFDPTRLGGPASTPVADPARFAAAFAGAGPKIEKVKGLLGDLATKITPRLTTAFTTAGKAATGMTQALLDGTGKARSAVTDLAARAASLPRNLLGAASTFTAQFGQLQGALTSTVGLANPAAVTRFTFALQDAGAVIGRILTPALDDLTDKVRGFADWILNLDPSTKELISKAARLSVALTGVGAGLTVVSPLLTAVSSGLTVAAGAASLLWTSLGPIGVALGAGAVAWGLYTGKLQEFAGSIGPLKPLVEKFGPLIDQVTEGFRGFVDGILEPVLPMLQQFGTQLLDLGQKAFGGLLAQVPRITQSFMGLVESAKPLIPVVAKLAQELGERLAKVMAWIGQFAADRVVKLFETWSEAMPDLIPKIEKLGEAWLKNWDALEPLLPLLGDLAGKFMDLSIQHGPKILGWMLDMNTATAELAATLGEGLVDDLHRAVKIVEVMASAMGRLKDKFAGTKSEVEGLTTAIKKLPSVRIANDSVEWAKNNLKPRDALRIIMPGLGPALDAIHHIGGALGGGTPPQRATPPIRSDKLPEIKPADLKPAAGPTGLTGPLGMLASLMAGVPGAMDNAKKLSSVGAAARPALYTSAEEFGRRARLSAFSAGRTDPAADYRKQKLANDQTMIGLLKDLLGISKPRDDRSADAIRGWRK